MDVRAPVEALPDEFGRAGFWRRALSMVVDQMIIILPLQVLAVVLFAATAGHVQMTGGISVSSCSQVSAIPPMLTPPPPHDPNFSRICKISFFGAPTASVLTVARVTQQSAGTTTVSRGYTLDENNAPIDAWVIDWIGPAGLALYLISLQTLRGRTLGNHLFKIRVIDRDRPGSTAIPLRRILLRTASMFIGFVPAIALVLYAVLTGGGDVDAMMESDIMRFLWPAFGVALVWILVLTIQIGLKRDPIYDRLAGTAVVRHTL